MKCLVIIGYMLILLRSLTSAQIHGGTTEDDENLSSDFTTAGNVSERVTTNTSQSATSRRNENVTLSDEEEPVANTTSGLYGSSVEVSRASDVAGTPTSDTGDGRSDVHQPTYTLLPQVEPEIDSSDIHNTSENSLTSYSHDVTEDPQRSTTTLEESTEYALTPSPSSSNVTEEEPVTEVFTPDASTEHVPDEITTVANSSLEYTSSPDPTHTTVSPETSSEGDVSESHMNFSSSMSPTMNSTEMPDDTQPTTELLTEAPSTAQDTTTTSSSSSSGPIITPVATDSTGSCFGEAEVNTLLVVAVVVAVNVLAVVVTAVCVHRIVSRRLTWDPPPIYYNRSKRGEQGRQRGQRSGRDLASDSECKAGEGGGAPATHIPILITNEDGWCVPYNEQEQKKKKEGATTEDTGV
ncbi:uncharacterized protein [Panulirus ornatus]|uniref:uncharacterized protein isoform X2 n=1 Tax=Panulirus ornatus TaxID=150431 RepID=UPI003A8BB191